MCTGAEVGLIIQGVAGAAALTTALKKPPKPSTPKLKETEADDAAEQARLAAEKRRKAALGAYGSQDTILGGALGSTSTGGTTLGG